MKKLSNLYSIGIGLTYLVFATLWIIFSDSLVNEWFAGDSYQIVQTYKGLLFVLLTGLALAFAIRQFYQKLEQKELFYHQTLNDASVAIVEFTEYKIVFTNQQFRKIFNFDESQLTLQLIDLVHPTSIAEVRRAIADVNQTKKPISVEIRPLHTQADSWFSLLLTKVQMENTSAFLGIITDISSAKRFSFYADFLLQTIITIDAQSKLNDVYEKTIELLTRYISSDWFFFVEFDDMEQLISYKKNIPERFDLSNLDFSSDQIHSVESGGFTVILIPLFDGKSKIGIIGLGRDQDSPLLNSDLGFLFIISADLGIKIGQKQRQIQHQRDEENQRLLLEAAQVATWEFRSKSGRFIKSANHSHVLGIEEDNDTIWSYDGFLNSIHPDDLKYQNAVLKQIQEKKKDHFDIEYRIKTKDGSYKWLNTSGRIHREIDDEQFIITGITMDIDHRKKQQETLIASEKTYKNLFENNPAALLIFDKESLMCISANRSSQKLYHYSEKQMMKLHFREFFMQKENSNLLQLDQLSAESDFKQLGVWTQVNAEKDHIYADLRASEITYNGRPAFLFMVNDVTEVALSQTALTKSEAKYRTLFQENPHPLFIINDLTELIIDVNDAVCQFFNKSRDELIKKSLSEVFGGRLTLEIELLFSRLSGEKLIKTETKITLEDKVEYFIEIAAHHLEVDNNPAIILFISDISSVKASEQKAMRAFMEGEDKERERMAKELHDSLGQILTAASMNLKSAQKELNTIDFKRKPQFLKGIEFVHQAIEDTRTIAQNLMPKTISDFGLISSLQLLISSYKDTLPFSIDVHHNLDDFRLERVIEMNIYRIIQESLTNIIKYAQASQVLITIENTGKTLRVEIKDDGRGIDFDNLQDGEGIGLKNMKSRVNIMNGEFFIDSIINSGTTIIVIIPIHYGQKNH